jgi:hypothetical protein
LQRSYPDYEQQQIAVFAISYDSVEVLAAFTEKYGITYPLLSDVGSRVIRELGLLNDRVTEQHAAYGIAPSERPLGTPYPGLILLDENGTVTEKRFHQSYRERETGAGILEDAFHVESSAHGAEARFASEGVEVRAWLDSEDYRYFQRLYLTVEVDVEPGLHIYGAPIPEGYIPLSVTVDQIEGLEVGAPHMPAPHPFCIEGLDEQFVVYDGRVTVPVPLTFTKRDAGDLVLSVHVRYQACSTNDCLMPASCTLELPISAAAFVASATPAAQ